MKDIAILLPYKENFTQNNAAAASIWVKDYLSKSNLKNKTIVYGNLNKRNKPLLKNFKNLSLSNTFLSKNVSYTAKFYGEYLKYKFKIIEIHNRPESLIYLIKKKVNSKLIFVYHNNPQDLRSSYTPKERNFIANNTDQIYFVSNWVKMKFFENLPYKHRNNCEILYPAINPLKKFPKKSNKIILSELFNKFILSITDFDPVIDKGSL